LITKNINYNLMLSLSNKIPLLASSLSPFDKGGLRGILRTIKIPPKPFPLLQEGVRGC
jgi:hypothetical protein